MIGKAIDRAFQTMIERNWNKIYWAIDLHGVCLKSNYENGGYTFINDKVLPGLLTIQSVPESRIILWSSCHDHEKPAIVEFFDSHGIQVHHFNENPEEKSTKTGCFDQKFYFSILLDDKAGFDPDTDWDELIAAVNENHAILAAVEAVAYHAN
jgi:hypothetical protein